METSMPDMTAYVVGGFLLFGTGVLLLFHCSSISQRKKRQRVEHGALRSGMEFNNGRKQFFRPWRNNKRKKSPVLHVFDVPSVVITPPSPNVTPRGGENDSIGSSGDLVRNIVVNSDAASSGQDKTCADTHNSGDVSRNVTSAGSSRGRRSSLGGNSSSSVSSSTSGSASTRNSSSRGRGSPTGCDVTRTAQQRSVLSLTDAEDDDLEDEPVVMRPRLSSMEPGTSKTDFNIPALVHCDDK